MVTRTTSGGAGEVVGFLELKHIFFNIKRLFSKLKEHVAEDDLQQSEEIVEAKEERQKLSTLLPSS
jgi:hypothetical protein